MNRKGIGLGFIALNWLHDSFENPVLMFDLVLSCSINMLRYEIEWDHKLHAPREMLNFHYIVYLQNSSRQSTTKQASIRSLKSCKIECFIFCGRREG